jgi:hypothetical protein
MSLGSIKDIVTVRPESFKKELDPGRLDGSGQVFRDLLAASASGPEGKNIGGVKAEKTAEILHLEMMRSALCLDGSPSSSTALGGGRLDSLLSAYGVGGQKTGMTPEKSTSAVAEVNENQSPRIDAASPVVPQGGGSSGITSLISRASRRYGVDEGLIKAVIQAESNFKPTAVSPAGAQGLMQLMPATAASLGVTDSFNPEQNVMAGTRFLKDLLNRYGGDLDKALAAYNWGPGNVDRGKSRLPQETRDYLVKVKKLYSTYSTA